MKLLQPYQTSRNSFILLPIKNEIAKYNIVMHTLNFKGIFSKKDISELEQGLINKGIAIDFIPWDEISLEVRRKLIKEVFVLPWKKN